MASRYYTQFKQKKAGASGGGQKPGYEGTSPSASVSEKTANWPGAAGPVDSAGFNRKTKYPVVKTTAKKQGVC